MATLRIASGKTTPGATGWVQYQPPENTGVFVDVDTTAGKFSATPVYITSIGGNASHWTTTGATSVYEADANHFRVYIRWANGNPLTPAVANRLEWHINWIGMEEA